MSVSFFIVELLPWRTYAARSSQEQGKPDCMNRPVFLVLVQADGNNSFSCVNNVAIALCSFIVNTGKNTVKNPVLRRNLYAVLNTDRIKYLNLQTIPN